MKQYSTKGWLRWRFFKSPSEFNKTIASKFIIPVCENMSFVVTLIGWLLLVLLLIISGILLYIIYSDWRLKRKCIAKGIPYLVTYPLNFFRFLWGSITLHELLLRLYNNGVKTGSQISGFNDAFAKLSYFVSDLDLARNIYVKDFDHFVNRRDFVSPEAKTDDIFPRMLFSLSGDHWKGVRSILSPAFGTGKIRKFYSGFEQSCEKLCDYLKRCVEEEEGGETDFSEAFSKYALDVIASYAFGVESNAFEGKIGGLSQFEKMAQLFQFKVDPLAFLKVGATPIEEKPQDYFKNIIKNVMESRKESGERQEDFLQLLIDSQEEGLLEKSKEMLEGLSGCEDGSRTGSPVGVEASHKLKFDEYDIVAHCVLFIMGGFDTTVSLLTFAAYALALEQNVQDTLFEEVANTMERNGGKLMYEEVHQMQYLDMFINETLRYFPPLAGLERMCTKDYKVPGVDLVIRKGSMVVSSVFGIHHDSRYYSDPEKFDPERFLPERKAERHPYSFTPFGHGPRNCIAMRFALTTVKTVLATLVYNFKLEPGKKTEIPVKFQSSVHLKPANGMWLRITPRTKDV